MTRVSGRMDRRALFASGAAAALLAASGVSARTQPRFGGRLRIALSGADRADTFDTRIGHGLFMQVATVGAVFDTLTEIAPDGTLRGELATAWEGSPDARSWIFHIRENVRFHDDTTFTARDAAASLELHRDGALDFVDTIEPLSDTFLRITLATPNADFPYFLAMPLFAIYPADQMAEAFETGIGTGLYRVQKFQPGRHFIGERVAEHYKNGTSGWFESVELVSIPSQEVRGEAIVSEYVDAIDANGAAFDRLTDITLLPEENAATFAVRSNIAHLPGVGGRWPLDNLRGAERWWMG